MGISALSQNSDSIPSTHLEVPSHLEFQYLLMKRTYSIMNKTYLINNIKV